MPRRPARYAYSSIEICAISVAPPFSLAATRWLAGMATMDCTIDEGILTLALPMRFEHFVLSWPDWWARGCQPRWPGSTKKAP
jgi:hypothetical protein